MASVVEDFHPRQIWLGQESHDPEMVELMKVVKHLELGIIPLHTGERFELGGANFVVLAPDHKPASRVRGQNDESLVLRVSYGATSMVLEGDAEKPTEQKLAKEIEQSDLLKVAHHGSATSTIPELLGAMHPRFAVISVGSHNSYGHPRNEVLLRLQNAKVSTFRTDMDGAVTFYLDGKTVTSRLAALR
jgi:competence protein ComEC